MKVFRIVCLLLASLIFSSCDFFTTLMDNTLMCRHSDITVNVKGEKLVCNKCFLDFTDRDNADTEVEASVLRISPDDGMIIGNEWNSRKNLFTAYPEAETIIVEDGVTTIRNEAFRGQALERLVLPSSLDTIDIFSFRECTNLMSIEFVEGLEAIGGGAFYKCTALQNIKLPASLTTLNGVVISSYNPFMPNEYYGAFDGSANLRNIEFEENSRLSYIGSWAFRDCSRLEEITIPISVTAIGDEAFLRCGDLKSFNFEGNAEEWALVNKGSNWNKDAGFTSVRCLNGTPDDTSDDVIVSVEDV